MHDFLNRLYESAATPNDEVTINGEKCALMHRFPFTISARWNWAWETNQARQNNPKPSRIAKSGWSSWEAKEQILIRVWNYVWALLLSSNKSEHYILGKNRGDSLHTGSRLILKNRSPVYRTLRLISKLNYKSSKNVSNINNVKTIVVYSCMKWRVNLQDGKAVIRSVEGNGRTVLSQCRKI